MAKKQTDGETAMAETLIPKEPENESGKEARQTYMVFARAVIREMSVDYPTLY